MAAFSVSLTFGLVGSLEPAILMVKKIEIAIFSKTQARAQPNGESRWGKRDMTVAWRREGDEVNGSKE